MLHKAHHPLVVQTSEEVLQIGFQDPNHALARNNCIQRREGAMGSSTRAPWTAEYGARPSTLPENDSTTAGRFPLYVAFPRAEYYQTVRLPVSTHASWGGLPRTTQDSVPGHWLGFAWAAISGGTPTLSFQGATLIESDLYRPIASATVPSKSSHR